MAAQLLPQAGECSETTVAVARAEASRASRFTRPLKRRSRSSTTLPHAPFSVGACGHTPTSRHEPLASPLFSVQLANEHSSERGALSGQAQTRSPLRHCPTYSKPEPGQTQERSGQAACSTVPQLLSSAATSVKSSRIATPRRITAAYAGWPGAPLWSLGRGVGPPSPRGRGARALPKAKVSSEPNRLLLLQRGPENALRTDGCA